MIKDGQVLIAIFRPLRISKTWVTSPGATRTHPVSYTVGGEGIIIPADVSLASCGADKLAFLVGAQPAVTPLIYGDTAFISTELAFGSPLCPWRLPWETERTPCGTVSLLNAGKNPSKVPANAIQA
ncbi:unnamed protein product [marine sediment metagenome]|uniref:Uncharacterized protein n=1 Tax=marine sediment metagenome TaxID=412755 RepID=X1N8G3_9ZZZZ